MQPYQLMGISNGANGTRQTLKLMASLARGQSTSQVIRELALAIVGTVAERDEFGEVKAILCFVQNRIRYVRDILNVETLQPPTDTLRLGQGDCDDKSILFASLVNAVGYPVKFIAMGETASHFSHVFCAVLIKGKWVGAETIFPWPLGKIPKKIVISMEQSL
jgi:transglutaminase-like putative cysteine protease